ncbi:ATPase [Candidatus Pelagibacter sp.]|nr:ATPase [Candidatus Pelagibacter sp.]
MTIDATFWVAISFLLFIGLLVYFKIPQKVNEILNQLILNIKNEIDESEKLRKEAKTLLDNSQTKLDSAVDETNKIIDQAKKDSEKLVIDINEKFHKSAEIKKKLAETKIAQMKEAAIKEIKDTSIKIAVNSVKKIIATSVDKNKLDKIFEKDLEEAKSELKKINSQ